jgi:hypothetical protein
MPTPEELWQGLVEEAGEDAIAGAASVSVAEAERDLTAAGFDVKAERARANATISELSGATPAANGATDPASEPTAWVSGPPPSARRARGSRKVVWLAAALVAAATAGGIVYAVGRRSKPPDPPIEVPPTPPTASATAQPAPLPVAPVGPGSAAPEKGSGPPWNDKAPAPHGPHP